MYQTESLPPIAALNADTDLPGPKLVVGDFSEPGICWSSFCSPKYLTPMVSGVRLGGWT